MKLQLYKHLALMIFVISIFCLTDVCANTVEYAHVFVPDKAEGAEYSRGKYEFIPAIGQVGPGEFPGYSRDQKVTDGRIVYNSSRYRMPFLNGYDHIVGIAGHLTDGLDRVEIVVNGNVVRTIRKAALLYCGSTTRNNERKGMAVFKVNRADLPDLNEDFQLRIRFAVEVAGFDKLDCKVVHGSGQIKSIQWTTHNNAELPQIFMTSSQRRVYKTDCRGTNTYNLRLICMKAPQSVQAGDGIKKEILDRDIKLLNRIDGTRMMDTIDATFTESYSSVPNREFGEKPEKFIKLCDAGVGNIPGGWGNYIYIAIADNLPGFDEGNPYRTNLKDLDLCGPGGGTATGQVIQPGQVSNNTGTAQQPTGQPDITVILENAFTSGATFNAADAARYDFCKNLPNEPVTAILPLTIRIKNTGTVNIRIPFNVAITRGSNLNFFDDYIETIPRLDVGEIYTLVIKRKQSVVCAGRSGTSCVRCPDNNSGGIRQWNDRGITVIVDNANVISESIETNNTATVP